MRLGIIGTAGRGSDAAKLTTAHFRMMTVVAQTVAETLGAKHLISGGAAWADASAVTLYLDRAVDQLTLHLPCEFVADPDPHFVEGRGQYDPGRSANRYHRAAKLPGLYDIHAAMSRGAEIHVNPGGFKARNTDVAYEVDTLLAFTFGEGATPADGGTLDTWRKFTARGKEANQLTALHPIWFHGYHFSLTDRRLYRTLCA